MNQTATQKLEALEQQLQSERSDLRYANGHHWTKALKDENRLLLAHYEAQKEEKEELIDALKGMVQAYGPVLGSRAAEDAKLLLRRHADTD